MPTRDEMIETLWAKAEIEKVMLDFGRALDLGDWALYRRCFADRFRVDFERLTGHPEVWVDADLWTRFAEIILSPMRRHHQYSNLSVTLDGDRADAVIYMVARHWKATDLGHAIYTQIGWYQNSFERTGGTWKISRLRHMFQWVEGNNGLFEFGDPALIKIMAQVFAPANRVEQ